MSARLNASPPACGSRWSRSPPTRTAFTGTVAPPSRSAPIWWNGLWYGSPPRPFRTRVAPPAPPTRGGGSRLLGAPPRRAAAGGRRFPKAVPAGQDNRPDRRHLAILLRQLLLEERSGAEQRDQRCGSGQIGRASCRE